MFSRGETLRTEIEQPPLIRDLRKSGFPSPEKKKNSVEKVDKGLAHHV
jgi:hypothetical protein